MAETWALVLLSVEVGGVVVVLAVDVVGVVVVLLMVDVGGVMVVLSGLSDVLSTLEGVKLVRRLSGFSSFVSKVDVFRECSTKLEFPREEVV